MNELRQIKSFKFGNIIYKVRHNNGSGVFDSFVCLLDMNMNEHFLGSLGAYTNNDWNKQVKFIDNFIIDMYRHKKLIKGERRIVVDAEKDVNISLSTFDSLMATIKKFIDDNSLESVLEFGQDDLYKYMPLQNNWIGFEIGSVKFYISSSSKSIHTVSAINVYTGKPIYNSQFNNIAGAMNSVNNIVDNEIKKHYDEIDSLNKAKNNISYITTCILG